MKNKKEERGSGWLFFYVGLMVILQLATVLLAKSKLYFVVSANVYLYFHFVAELLTIIIGFIIFYYANRSYNQAGSNAVRMIGWAFLAMAVIDVFHTIAYKGFPALIFQPGSNVGIWFWLPARFVGATLLFFSALFGLGKLGNRVASFLKYVVILFVIVLIPLVIYNTYHNILPLMFMDGVGLTSLKIFLEYFVMAFFGITALLYCYVLHKNSNKTLLFFIFGMISSVFSELSFTLYTNVFDVFNMLGHVLKIVAYGFFLAGLIYLIKIGEKS